MSRYNENDKVLIIVKKKEFSRTNTTIQNRSIRLNEHAFFNFNIIFMMKTHQSMECYFKLGDGHRLYSLSMI